LDFKPLVGRYYQSTNESLPLASIENAYLRDKIALLENMLDDIKGDRDHWRNQATMLLTHQPETPKVEQPTRSRLYEKLFGRKS
jgi:hypothetical protein